MKKKASGVQARTGSKTEPLYFAGASGHASNDATTLTPDGGVGYQVDLLDRGLTGRGHNLTVFVADDVGPSHGHRTIPIPVPRRDRALRIIGRAFARLSLSEFDVLHAHGNDWLFRRRPRLRTFYRTALMEARTETGRLREGSQLCHYALEWVSSLGPLTVVISQRTRRYLPLMKGSSVAPSTRPSSILAATGLRSPRFCSVLFVAGTLAGRKRNALLLRAFDEVQAALPQARLTIVSRDGVDQREVNLHGRGGGRRPRRPLPQTLAACSASSL